MMRYLFVIACSFAIMSLATGAPSEIKIGKYVRENDSGTLIIKRDKQNRLGFEIDAIGINGHTCWVTGIIRKNIGYTEIDRENDTLDSKCEIAFVPNGSSLNVDPITQEGCRYYCGFRGYFNGNYAIPPASCTNVGRQKTRNHFLSLYRTHQYQKAESTLQNLLTQCHHFMHWIEQDHVRNDLALTQYHRGHSIACLKTLNATVAAQVRDEEEMQEENHNIYIAPVEYQSYLPVAKSIWFNKALCTKNKTEKH